MKINGGYGMLEGMVRKQTEKQAQTLDNWLEKHDR